MKTYPIPMIPGPVRVPVEVLAAYQTDYGSADLEAEFLDLYNQTENYLQCIIGTKHSIAIQSGEGMLALWGALKSCLQPGDRVLSLATGVFGYGIAQMAQSLGAEVQTVGLEYDHTLHDWDAIEQAIKKFRPKMITAVHCETPSGTLNPLTELGKLKLKYEVPLLYVDAVASLGGADVQMDEWEIDLLLGGSQKCLSAPPGMCFTAVSPSAWQIIERVGYQGYDALLPFKTAQENFYFPYTPYWHGVAALNAGARLLIKEGLENCFRRHTRAAQSCRQGLTEIGIRLFPARDAIPSPTVTAAYVPEGISWTDFNTALRLRGLAAGGSYGLLAGKVFRLGHMGAQADEELVLQAVQAVTDVMTELRLLL